MNASELAVASRIVRDALKDKSYRSTPLGLEAARYLRWKRNEWGASPETILAYEPVLARLALFFADLDLAAFEGPAGVERLRECLDFHWHAAAAATRQRVICTWRDFFEWAVQERGMLSNPARRIRLPKTRGVRREPFQREFVDRVIAHQEHACDKVCVALILMYGIRRAELGRVRFRDFDHAAKQLTVDGKGGVLRTLPIVEEWILAHVAGLELELGGPSVARDLFLLGARRKVGMETKFFHYHGLKTRSISRWWYDRLEEAGLVGDRDSGTRSGLSMHRGRHTVATEILRRTGNIVAAKELLGHKSIETTSAAYASFDTRDLAAVLRAMRDED